MESDDPSAGLYYSGTFWNDWDETAARMNLEISGERDVTWFEHVKRQPWCGPFRRGLMLNCGNGWVERMLLEHGVIESVVAIDYSPNLLAEAAKTAEDAGIPISYHQMDTNTAAFPEGPYDVVINHAAGHHITNLDRVFRAIAQLLPEDGVFLNHDYVGPHRNQYTYDQWQAAFEVNQQLPEALRQDMLYPHLPTMLETDPSEAVHSELVLSTLGRYFTLTEYKPLGGAIAYLLMTFNEKLRAADQTEAAPWVAMILDADRAYLEAHPDETMFAWAVGTPRKDVLADTEQLAAWTAEEDEREESKDDSISPYYPLTAFQSLMLEVSDLRLYREHMLGDIHAGLAREAALEAEIAALRRATGNDDEATTLLPDLGLKAALERSLRFRGGRLVRRFRRG